MSTAPRHRIFAARRWADACGIAAILSWGTLGLLGQMASSLPPFLVTAACFAGAARTIQRTSRRARRSQRLGPDTPR